MYVGIYPHWKLSALNKVIFCEVILKNNIIDTFINLPSVNNFLNITNKNVSRLFLTLGNNRFNILS